MARSEAPESVGADQSLDDQSLGELISIAVKDVTQLVRYEVDLAKAELRSDAKRVGVLGALIAIAAFFAFFILICLAFAWVYALHAFGAWGGMYGAFLWAALSFAVFAFVLGYGGFLWFKRRHLTGLTRTRQAVSESLSVLRRKDSQDSEVSEIGKDADRKDRKDRKDTALTGGRSK